MKKTKKVLNDGLMSVKEAEKIVKQLKKERRDAGHPEDAANIDAYIREVRDSVRRQPTEVIVKVIHEYKDREPSTQYKQSHPDEYEWSNFWNDWVPVQR